MLDSSEHMLLLLQQAKIKNERPADSSFLPISLAMASLLRQPPAGLTPPAGGLSLPQLDRLSQAAVERKLAAMILDDPLKVFTFICALVRYVKTTRKMLTVCHEHMTNRRSTVEATQGVVQAVVDALPPLLPTPDEEIEEFEDVKAPVSRVETPSKPPAMEELKPHESEGDKHVGAAAIDPAGIMRRAVGRDVGDGSAVLEIMRKYPSDARIQAHGIRALKGVIRSAGASAEPSDAGDSIDSTRQPKPSASLDISTPEDNSDDEGSSDSDKQSQNHDAFRAIIQMVIDKMKQFPASTVLQRDGLLTLAEYANQADGHIAVITSSGGVISIINAMVLLPDDVPANMAGLSVLAHPKIADETIVRVNPESRRLVLSAMERFPLNEQVQGLGCLALANLSLRQDASMLEIASKGGLEMVVESMKRFSTTALVQAAGCWLIAIVSGKNEEMKTACFEAGALPACEKARLRFPNDPKVQQHAVQAIQAMLPGEVIDQVEAVPLPSCELQ